MLVLVVVVLLPIESDVLNCIRMVINYYYYYLGAENVKYFLVKRDGAPGAQEHWSAGAHSRVSQSSATVAPSDVTKRNRFLPIHILQCGFLQFGFLRGGETIEAR